MVTNFTRNNHKALTAARILEYITDEWKLTTVSELSIITGVGESTIYGYRSGNTIPNWNFMRSVNRFLIKEHDCYIIRTQFRGPVKAVANGSPLDEMRDMLKETTEIDEHLTNEEYQKALNDCQQMRAIVDRYEAEIEHAKNANQ